MIYVQVVINSVKEFLKSIKTVTTIVYLVLLWYYSIYMSISMSDKVVSA